METELSRMHILRLSNEESNRVTREALQTAMFKLMGEFPFEKITVSEITKRAGVSRAAFYRNYDSKEELVQDTCKTVLDSLTESVGSERFQNDRREWYRSFFQTIGDNAEYFRIYLNAHLSLSDQLIMESVYPSNSVKEHYRHAAREGAFLSVLIEWFEDGMKESAEEMAGVCSEILNFD